MYSYEWDPQTGGYILNLTPLALSKEPRPVYYKELDILGFDNYWNYPKSDMYPLMWAEANNYIYRGRVVAKTKGGSLHKAPEIIILEEPEPCGEQLKFVDIPAMVEKNKDILESMVQSTIKNIYNTYQKYQNKVDIFYVAFSGGKDSIVTLDLVQRALPHDKFKVLFGDTKMEFPDTYEAVKKVKESCLKSNIDFLIASSHFDPSDSWKLFGSPSTVTRWCCSVHKTSPQIILLREILKKNNFTGMAFIGVRASESLARSEYDYISLGEKHKGQYSCNPILEWNTAELFLYIYSNNLVFNNAYKKGNKRAGCLVCPRAAERNEYMCAACYPEEVAKYESLIGELYKDSFPAEDRLRDFIKNGGWKARKNGRDLNIQLNYNEVNSDKGVEIIVSNPKTDWKEWIKTIGILENNSSPFYINFRGNRYSFLFSETDKFIKVFVPVEVCKQDPIFVKLFKNVFRKAACCVGCRECEADCHNGCLSIKDGQVKVSDNCKHCAECHKTEKGCLVYKSLELPRGGIKVQQKSLNCYSHFGPKLDWINQYFKYKDDFDTNHNLGSQMYGFFKRFLRDSNLIDSKGFSETAEIVEKLGLDNEASWGLLLTNLAYTPQIGWFITHTNFVESYDKKYILSMLVNDGAKESWVNDIWSAFARFIELPFSQVGLGSPIKEGNKTTGFSRSAWKNPDPLVVLYSLYKFSEACGDYKQFSLTRLLNHDIESDGISPTEIFGLDRDTMEVILNGLSIKYPDYISVSFTLDLDNINLKDKTSEDVLKLIAGE